MSCVVRTANERSRLHTMLLLRWLLIIATSYLMLFSRPLRDTPAVVALFVSGYFASNIILANLLRRVGPRPLIDTAVVLFDALAISLGLFLTDNVSSDFFLLYFMVLFLGTLTQRLGLVVTAALIAGVIHLVTLSQFLDLAHLIEDGYTVRVPFLFVVALFFAHMVQEESQARERVHMEFLSTVGHDLKNPLAVVQSIAELLLSGNVGALSEDQSHMVRRILASARHVISLSQNLLNAARIEAGQLTLLRSPVSLDSIIEETVSVARSASVLKQVELKCNSEPSMPIAHLDPVQIERVVSNLLDNAIKHTPAGTTVTASASATPRDIVLTVRDDGPGIPAKELPTLFQKYHRQGMRTREGSGLGLYIVKAIVEAHGGSVAVESQVGRGTAFTVRLPRSERDSVDRAPRYRWHWLHWPRWRMAAQ